MAVAVDHERGRRQLDVAELLGDRTVIHCDLERQLPCLRIVGHIHRRIVLHRDGNEFEPLVLEAVVCGGQLLSGQQSEARIGRLLVRAKREVGAYGKHGRDEHGDDP
ncbi:hypothetical protein DFQ28_000508 [Apophysomyces sp. BC1034]|nr:hypothetical protein DFQ28_000508 [Apophysomyces sp. BC1034]